MKTPGYLILLFVSLFTFTPIPKVKELPSIKVHNIKDTSIDSLKLTLNLKKDSLENIKLEVKELQKEIGIRK